MKRQLGASTAAVLAALIGLGAAGGAGYYGWQQKEAHDRARAELATAKAALEKMSADMRAARELIITVGKDLEQMKATAEQLRSERDGAMVFLEAERAHRERLRAELTLAQQQLAFVRGRATVPQFAEPRAITRPPMVIQALPAPRPQGAQASPIQAVPPQGYQGIPR